MAEKKSLGTRIGLKSSAKAANAQKKPAWRTIVQDNP